MSYQVRDKIDEIAALAYARAYPHDGRCGEARVHPRHLWADGTMRCDGSSNYAEQVGVDEDGDPSCLMFDRGFYDEPRVESAAFPDGLERM
jgi:hypothetical protein